MHLSVATSERWNDRQSGDPRERTEWHRVVIYNEHLADIAERYLILDMDSSESPTHGQQEGSAWNGHFGCTCYHPLRLQPVRRPGALPWGLRGSFTWSKAASRGSPSRTTHRPRQDGTAAWWYAGSWRRFRF